MHRPTALHWALLALLAAPWMGPAAAPYVLDEETRKLLVDAIESATALDLYNARCRSDQSGRHLDNLNRELAGKLGTTAVAVQDEHFPERGFRAAQARMQAEIQEALHQAGGCKGAKDSGLALRLRSRFEGLLEAIEALP